jgi:hypothetical protein
MKRKIKTIGIISMLFLTACFAVTAGNEADNEQIVLTYNFPNPLIEDVEIENIKYQSVSMSDTLYTCTPNEPRLPVKEAHILLPQGSHVENVKISGEEKYLDGDFLIEPCKKSMSISHVQTGSAPIPDDSIYSSSEPYPGRLYDIVDVQGFRGYDILMLKLYPVQYLPSSGKLMYYPSLKVTVTTKETNEINPLFRGLEIDRSDVVPLVDNPEMINSYSVVPQNSPSSMPLLSGESYDMVIITSRDLLDESEDYSFYALREAHKLQGLSTGIATVEDIYEIATGTTNQIKIKQFIYNLYHTAGLRYVLLGGDDPFIPVKTVGIRHPYDGTITDIPADQWYVNLDDDYIPELNIGRACVENINEVRNFVFKTIYYMSGEEEDYRTVLLAGEKLDDGGDDYPPTYGGDSMDELINECNTNGYTTSGFPSGYYDIDKLYDRDMAGEWDDNEIINYINNHDPFIINHLGHSQYYINMRIGYETMYLIKNSKPCFIYSQGCWAGAFDNPKGYDCIAEYFTAKMLNGAFAGIWNARSGRYYGGETSGPSHMYNRMFWHGIFSQDMNIGSAHQYSKSRLASYAASDYDFGFCYWELTLLGDPALEIKIIDPPNTPSTPQGKQKGGKGVAYNYTTSTTDPQGLDVFYLWDFGDGTYNAWNGPYKSGETCKAQHTWYSDDGDIATTIRVKAKNTAGAESDWSNGLKVSMPHVKQQSKHGILVSMLQQFLEHFQILFRFQHVPLVTSLL